MKRILKYLPILLVFFGCDSFLDRESYDKMDSDGYYNSTTALNSAVIACYNGIQDALDKEFFLTEVRRTTRATVIRRLRVVRIWKSLTWISIKWKLPMR